MAVRDGTRGGAGDDGVTSGNVSYETRQAVAVARGAREDSVSRGPHDGPLGEEPPSSFAVRAVVVRVLLYLGDALDADRSPTAGCGNELIVATITRAAQIACLLPERPPTNADRIDFR